MASILPGYEYDIFVSYRHNDNRSGWVTDFVSALQEELAATIKEPLSIYFDKNPHDGLLETHVVDDSLKEKLKCLIFIPIVSQTYCDPRSFAWSNEFLVFMQQAQADAHGLKVRLSNGNMASRVLPIRIHELDPRDKKTIEDILGPLRAIDFTYQSAGVNRPLRPKDDEAVKGPSQNVYRDQVNKTANAIKEIIAGLQGKDQMLVPVEVVASRVSAMVDPPRRSAPKLKMPSVSKTTIALIVSLLALITLAFYHFSEAPLSVSTYRTNILMPENTKMAFTEFSSHFVISPDGNMIVFAAEDSVGNSLLWVRALGSLNAQPLIGTKDAIFPFWSPDSRSIGFFANSKIKTIPAEGGPVQTLCYAPSPRGGTWGRKGFIVFNAGLTGSPLSQVSERGGASRFITSLDTSRQEGSHRWPSFLPDGQHFLYLVRKNRANLEENAIFLASLDSTERPRMIIKANSSMGYANGHLLFVRDGLLMAQPFDEDALQIGGDAFPVGDNVYVSDFNSKAAFSVSQNGSMVYQSGEGASRSELTWQDRTGTRKGSLNHNTESYQAFRLSPDASRIAVAHSDRDQQQDIWIYEVKRGTWTRFTFDSSSDIAPVWSPDGKKIVFGSNRSDNFVIYQRSSNGEAAEELLLKMDGHCVATDWSRDGKYLVLLFVGKNTGNDIFVLSMDPKIPLADRKPTAFLQTEFHETRAMFSPDSRWIAYQSNESGRNEIYLRPFPGPGGKWQVSTNGGTRPQWRGDGKEIFFSSPDLKIMAAEVKLGSSTAEIGSATALFDTGVPEVDTRDMFDVTPDGKMFLVARPIESNMTPITLVVNGLGKLKK